jgi:putative protease
MKEIEILAPVGDQTMLAAAINAGADAVYLGIKGINMRDCAKNFSLSDLPNIVNVAHTNNVNVYLTLNTIIFENEIQKVGKILQAAKKANVDAVIAWDLAVLELARKEEINVHLSTQGSASNSLAINQYKHYGVQRVVLARECTLDEIQEITKKTEVDIEVFIHGAMCVSESGRCFMSQFQFGKSANRGECWQPCRRRYKITDDETGEQLNIENTHVLSPKDMCTIHIIDKIIDAGVAGLKIEGRGRNPEYVDTVVRIYKQAVDLTLQNKLTIEKKKEFVRQLQAVYNRGFSNGFYLGRPINDFWNDYGGGAQYSKHFLGKVLNYYPKAGAFYGNISSKNLSVGDELMIQGPTTGNIKVKVTSLRNEAGKPVNIITKGETYTCLIDNLVRKNDNVYKKVKN